MTALYDWEPLNPDELALKEHDEVEVQGVEDSSWATGLNSRTGKVGVFPRNYCTPIA